MEWYWYVVIIYSILVALWVVLGVLFAPPRPVTEEEFNEFNDYMENRKT